MVKEEDSSAFVSAEEESNSMLNVDDDWGDERFSDGVDSFVNVDTDDNAVSREPTRPGSPLVDFLGEKLGPKRCRARTGGKRGRPRGALKPGASRESFSSNEVSISGAGSVQSSPHGKRGPGRPRMKAGGSSGPQHQGSRGPGPGPGQQQPKLSRVFLPA